LRYNISLIVVVERKYECCIPLKGLRDPMRVWLSSVYVRFELFAVVTTRIAVFLDVTIVSFVGR
jgi:hypothetical protein